ncbi:peptidoglycan editing factor PgeF [Phormidium tenue FACHB-886]|nr:peptidoglycan editing factor PgeF [Phormidium tenue FACHB-886]
MHSWHWQTYQDLNYLTCSLLQDWQHGFFTKRSRPPAELTEAIQPSATVHRVKQVHGNGILTALEATAGTTPESPEGEALYPEADGLVSDRLSQALWVCSADCTPALIADVQTKQVAAVHAGWRGTALKIVPMAIARLQAQGSQLQNLRFALGPAIAGEVYQVSIPVAAEVGATVLTGGFSSSESSSEFILNALKQFSNPPILDDPQPERVRLDVRRIIALQLEQLGIAPDQVAIAPYCTYQTPDLFFSYRREKQKKVQWSGIVSGRNDER